MGKIKALATRFKLLLITALTADMKLITAAAAGAYIRMFFRRSFSVGFDTCNQRLAFLYARMYAN